MRSLLFCFLMLPLLLCASQIDSLRTELASVSGEQRYDLLLSMAKAWMPDHPDSALHVAREVLDATSQREESELHTTALVCAADASRLLHHYAAAQAGFSEAMEHPQHLTDEQIAYIYNAMGNISEELCDFDDALQYHLQSLAVNRRNKQAMGEAGALNNIGNIYFNLGNTSKARDYYLQSLAIKQEMGDSLAIAGSLGNLGNICFSVGENDAAMEYYHQAETILSQLNNTEVMALFLNNLGNLFGEMQEYDRARDHFQQALEYYQDAGNYRGMARTRYNLGNCLYYQQDAVQAERCFIAALEQAQQIGYRDISLAALLSLANLAQEQHHDAVALKYLRDYVAIKDSVYSEETNSAVAELQMQYELEKQNREKEQYRLAAEQQKNTILQLGIGLMLLLGAALFVLWRYRSKARLSATLQREIEKALQKQQEQQQIIVHQANLTALGEMAAGIAHEINQPLQNISLSAEAMELALNNTDLDAEYLRGKLHYVYQDIRRIHTIADHISLFSSEQATEIKQPFSINESITNALFMMRKPYQLDGITLHSQLSDDIPPVMGNSCKVEQMVLNLLSNARHALRENATCIQCKKEVTLRSYRQQNSAVIEVQDTGCGIAPEIRDRIFHPFFTTKEVGQGSGLGLSISYGIAREMGGTVLLASPADPTIFRINLPLWEDR